MLAALAGVAGAGAFALVREYALVCATGAFLGGLAHTYASQVFAYSRELAELTGRSLARGTAAVRAVFSAGWVLGPPAGLFLLTRTGFGTLYASLAALLLLAALLARWVLPRVPRAGTDRRAGGLRRALSGVPRRTWLLLGAATAVNVADQMYLIALAAHVTRDLGLSAALVGALAGTCAALEIPLLIGAGRLAGRLGEERLVGGRRRAGGGVLRAPAVRRLGPVPAAPPGAERAVNRRAREPAHGPRAARDPRRRGHRRRALLGDLPRRPASRRRPHRPRRRPDRLQRHLLVRRRAVRAGLRAAPGERGGTCRGEAGGYQVPRTSSGLEPKTRSRTRLMRGS